MTASAHWRRLVRARMAQMERLEPGRGTAGPEFWNAQRARRFAANLQGAAGRDPFLVRVRSHVQPGSTVLDVGAGTGRFALELATRAGRVTAVDPSPAMLQVLRRDAQRRRLTNIDHVNSRWQDAEVGPADISVCSYVLPLVEDAAGFLAKLDAATTARAFVYMNGASADLVVDPFWRHFHRAPRKPSPTYIDALDVLAELGISAGVEVVEVPGRSRFATLEAAISSYRDMLVLPDTAAVRRELRGLLAPWLVARGGELRPPVRTWPAAIISWEPNRAPAPG